LSARPPAGQALTGWSNLTGYGVVDVAAAIAARASITTQTESHLGGYVSGTPTGDAPLGTVVGIAWQGPGGALLVLGDHSAAYGLGASGVGQVAVYKLHVKDPASLLSGRGATSLPSAGQSAASYLDDLGTPKGTLAVPGGVLGLIGAPNGID